VRTDGVTVATSYADLTDGALAAAISVDENGNEVTHNGLNGWAWSATADNGTGPVAATCSDWTLADGGNQGGKGATSSSASNWSTNFNPGSFNCAVQPARPGARTSGRGLSRVLISSLKTAARPG
jgi:hypothetical protein